MIRPVMRVKVFDKEYTNPLARLIAIEWFYYWPFGKRGYYRFLRYELK